MLLVNETSSMPFGKREKSQDIYLMCLEKEVNVHKLIYMEKKKYMKALTESDLEYVLNMLKHESKISSLLV